MPRRISSACSPCTLACRAGDREAVGPEGGKNDGLAEQIGAVLRHWAVSEEHTEQTRTRMSETVTRFAGRLDAAGISDLRDVTGAEARGFVLAPTRYGEPPELATQHARRTALRTMFRTARLLRLVTGDPTLDLALRSRGTLTARPLTDEEVTLCRASAQATRGNGSSRRVAAWALGESGAVSSEIAALRIGDLDDPTQPRAVDLPGTRRHDARTAPLTAWASTVLTRRVAELRSNGASDAVLLAYGGLSPPGGAKAQAAVCNALRDVLNAAGLLGEPDVRPASLRNWVGRTAYDAGAPVEAVALLLGLRSLDATAEDIGLCWRQAASADAAETRRNDGIALGPTVRRGAPITLDISPNPAPRRIRDHVHLDVVTDQEETP